MRKNNLVKIYEEYKNRRLGHIILWEMKKERKCLKKWIIIYICGIYIHFSKSENLISQINRNN